MTSDSHAAQANETAHDDHSGHHVCSFQLFAGVFFALLILTIVTVAVSRFDFGGFNMIIAMAIAAVKASLVMSIFMHMRWDTAINNIAFLSSILFLSLLFLFTLADYTTRGDTDPILATPSMQMKPAEYYQHDWTGH
ncbi:MAG: cytochrome C oxidase subunit IV family protein [Planctomycetota bacterium]|jgi:cytochrome c oxidase subunit 4